LLGVALLADVSQTALKAALAFYLVGATVGLFRHLRNASARDAIIEDDYGLSTVRLLQLPLFSGIAGVAFTALVPVLAHRCRG